MPIIYVLAGLLCRRAPATMAAEQRAKGAARFGSALSVLTLLIVVGIWLLLKVAETGGQPQIDPNQATLVSLGIGAVVALVAAIVMLRARVREARRLVETTGWAAVLPQMLAVLGMLFAGLPNVYVPLDTPLLAVVFYAVFVALYTAIIGDAYVASVLTTANIGLPLVIHKFGGDPVVVCALGMVSSFCGTLPPMAANFNVVPAALLELPDRNGVIRVQAPTALILLLGNIVLMYVLAFPR